MPAASAHPVTVSIDFYADDLGHVYCCTQVTLGPLASVGAPIAQLAEAADLKSAQCRFESDWGH